MPNTNLAELEDRARRLFSNHTAITVLDVLNRGEPLSRSSLQSTTDTVNDAVTLLQELGLVENRPTVTGESAYQATVLTPRGRRVVDLLEEITRHDR